MRILTAALPGRQARRGFNCAGAGMRGACPP
ncbi:hypothetical protein ACWT_1978 [Actinoplanes sp. SE50]|nr:hypothetical protein ACPL_2100 [Actinoplanes sp. SE50/110]ATO81393.1 hypothetical protein ACWT_1978 [Actinoplanes sp. SE50]SLL98800.1 hypothetical protein ACSP50_2027 [Actinoplanes sp. SE50/110]